MRVNPSDPNSDFLRSCDPYKPTQMWLSTRRPPDRLVAREPSPNASHDALVFCKKCVFWVAYQSQTQNLFEPKTLQTLVYKKKSKTLQTCKQAFVFLQTCFCCFPILFGFSRVSTQSQNPSPQVETLADPICPQDLESRRFRRSQSWSAGDRAEDVRLMPLASATRPDGFFPTQGSLILLTSMGIVLCCHLSSVSK